ncbi:MAG: Tex-like N-terminal domain-containing protein, partial [Bacteroidota bacterium]
MQATYYSLISKALSIPDRQVNQTAALLDGGATVPFIARYRKEATGGLDEVQIAAVRDRLQQFREVDQRRAAILKSIEAQGLLDDALRAKLAETWSMTALEDLYLPFRPKRKTRASVARERGLEPLAKILMAQREPDPEGRARTFCGPDVPDAAHALKGARDIVAEWVNEHRQARYRLRRLYQQEAI